MSEDFCKLYRDGELGQILVKIDTNSEGKPAVQFSFVPEGLGVCSAGPVFEDTDSGWDKAEHYFTRVTEGIAVDFVKAILKELLNTEEGPCTE